MKAKKIALFVTVLLISFMVINFDAFAQFNDVDSSPFISSINKMHDLEILKGVGNNSFKPDGSVTREQFATIIIKVLDLEESANLNKSKSVFSDVEVGRWSIGFINEAYHKNLITGKTDGLFYPEEDINYGQLCTMMVKALGYNDTDVTGVWPYNYVNKARDLEIIKNLNIDPFECVKREEIAYILDKNIL